MEQAASSLSELVASLQTLRAEGERCRAELYWTMQRLQKSRRRSAELLAWWNRRNGLRVHREPIIWCLVIDAA